MQQPVLGIDVAKATLAVCLLLATGTHRSEFANTAVGHQQLLAWLRKHKLTQLQACLEATGTYGEDVALALHEAGHVVSVVNPARIAAYAKSQLARTKTDPSDAALIARFCAKEQPPAWSPPAPEVRELRALVRHLEALRQIRQQEANRLSSGSPSPLVAQAVQEHLAFLDHQITDLIAQIDQHIDKHPDLKEQRDLIATIKGIGPRTAATLLAELGDVRAFGSARQLAAYAGLNPREYTSGSSVRKRTRLSKTGNAAIRKALYFPALSAVQHNPLLSALRTRLLARGLSKMAVIGAAMRKLLHLVYGVVKTGRPFDPHYALVAMVC
jgi:transposase